MRPSYASWPPLLPLSAPPTLRTTLQTPFFSPTNCKKQALWVRAVPYFRNLLLLVLLPVVNNDDKLGSYAYFETSLLLGLAHKQEYSIFELPKLTAICFYWPWHLLRQLLRQVSRIMCLAPDLFVLLHLQVAVLTVTSAIQSIRGAPLASMATTATTQSEGWARAPFLYASHAQLHASMAAKMSSFLHSLRQALAHNKHLL